MRCFGKDGGQPCDEEGTIPDLETPPIFVSKDDPLGPGVRPHHCPKHHREMMRRRDENEASWSRAFR